MGIRRYGEPVERGRRYGLRAGAYGILRRGDEILATFQAAPTPELQLPGGGIDPGESPLAALHREVFEETGWRIAAPRRLGAYRRFCYMPDYDRWAEKLCHVYAARPIRPLGPPSEAGHMPVWVPVEDAVRMVASAGDAAFLRRALAL